MTAEDRVVEALMAVLSEWNILHSSGGDFSRKRMENYKKVLADALRVLVTSPRKLA